MGVRIGFKGFKAGLVVSVLMYCLAVTVVAGGRRAAAPVEKYSVKIPGGTYKYQVNVGGTLDEFNTADYLEAPLGSKNVGSKRLKSKFQPNEYLVIENIGEKDVVNPRIVINGRRNWYSTEDILTGILKRGMTTAEKAMAIWGYVSSIELQCHENDRRVDSGSTGKNRELTNPVKWSNSYYCSGCQFAASVIVVLCQKAGIAAADTRTVGLGSAHRIAEIRWAGDWHVLDGDERMFHLERDNKTIASVADIAADPELCDRTHGGGFASGGLTKKRGVQFKDNPKKVTEFKDIGPLLSTMSMTIRPGEKFVWRWDNDGKYRCGDNRRNIKASRPEGLEPYQLANGKMIYSAKLKAELFEKNVFKAENMHSVINTDGEPQLQPIEAGKTAYVIYKASTPYPIVGANVGGEVVLNTAGDNARLYVSVYEPNDFKEIFFARGHQILRQRAWDKRIRIDDILNPKPTRAIYQYYVKYEVFAKKNCEDAVVTEIYLQTDVQMSGTALPSLSAGINNVVYRDDSGRGSLVEVIHGWKESSITRAPSAPAGAVEPNDGGVVGLKSLRALRWKAAADPDGRIADYHIQVSARPDMLYPVSPNFDRITFAQHPLWPVPKGWLNEGQKYYWRVRSRDNWGVWSRWSKVWSFKIADSG